MTLTKNGGKIKEQYTQLSQGILLMEQELLGKVE